MDYRLVNEGEFTSSSVLVPACMTMTVYVVLLQK